MNMGHVWIIVEAILNIAVATWLYPGLWAELADEGPRTSGRLSLVPFMLITLGYMTVPNLYDNTPLYKSVLTWYLFSLLFPGFAWAMKARAEARQTMKDKASR